MARNHIHFAIGYNNENHVVSGMRNSSDIIIEVDAAAAIKDGFKFLRSKNDVILCPGKGPKGLLPPKYFKSVTYRKQKNSEVKFDLRNYEFLLVLDFEANCIEDGALKCQEIIEFPIVPIDTKNNKILQEKIFHHYVKPTVVPEITPFCTKLTGITQDNVNQGIEIGEVLIKLEEWVQLNGFTPANSTIVTCGNWDLNTCLRKEAEYKKISLRPYLEKYINIKDIFCSHTCQEKAGGMDKMLEEFELPLDGKHHSGIDDSKNIAKIVLELLKEKSSFSKLQEHHLNPESFATK